MNKIGLASIAAVVLTSGAMAGFNIDNAIEITGAVKSFTGTGGLANARQRSQTDIYSTNWTTDSNGASYTVGNISTNVNASAAGQGGWWCYSSGTGGNNAALTNYKINVGSPPGRTGQSLSVSGSSTASGSRYMYQDLNAGWSGRNSAENTLWVEWDQYMASTASTTGVRQGGVVYDTTGTRILCGLYADYGTNSSGTRTKGTIYGISSYNNNGSIGNYIFKLSGVTMDDGSVSPMFAGSWNQIATNFNQDTGMVEWYYSSDNFATYTGFYVDGASAGFEVLEFDYYATSTTGNTVAGVATHGDLAVYTTPAPGAVALVGLAGLMARRRRA